jgi:hypothetical protein
MTRQETERGRELLVRLGRLGTDQLVSIVVELASRVADQQAELRDLAGRLERAVEAERLAATRRPPALEPPQLLPVHIVVREPQPRDPLRPYCGGMLGK